MKIYREARKEREDLYFFALFASLAVSLFSSQISMRTMHNEE